MSYLLDCLLGEPVKQMADYLDSIVPEDKLELIENGFSRLMTTLFITGFITGMIFGLLSIAFAMRVLS